MSKQLFFQSKTKLPKLSFFYNDTLNYYEGYYNQKKNKLLKLMTFINESDAKNRITESKSSVGHAWKGLQLRPPQNCTIQGRGRTSNTSHPSRGCKSPAQLCRPLSA
jgi:hypothetical protein